MAAAAKAIGRRPGCFYPGQARRPASGARTSRTQHAYGLRRPRSAERGGCAGEHAPAGPDTRSCPMPWPVENRRAHLREGRGQLGKAHGRGGSSGDASFLVGRGSEGVGWTLGWRLGAKPAPLETASRRSRLVPRPAPGPRPGRVPPRSGKAGAAGVPSNRRAAGVAAKDMPERTRGPVTSACHRCGWPRRRPLGVGSPAAPRPQCLTKRLTSKTSLVWSMW